MTNIIKTISGTPNSLLTGKKNITQESSSETKFSDMLNNAINQVVDDSKTADTLSKQLATGDVKDLSQVMIAMEKADLGLQLTVQVRNKVIEAYQEIMRMQV